MQLRFAFPITIEGTHINSLVLFQPRQTAVIIHNQEGPLEGQNEYLSKF